MVDNGKKGIILIENCMEFETKESRVCLLVITDLTGSFEYSGAWSKNDSKVWNEESK